MSGQASASRSQHPVIAHPTHLHHIQVWKSEHEYGLNATPVQPSEVEFSIVAAAAHYAIRMLEGQKGREALQRLGTLLCVAWILNGTFTQEETAAVTRDMRSLVDLFVSQLRDNFFPLMITDFPTENKDNDARSWHVPPKNHQPHKEGSDKDPNIYDFSSRYRLDLNHKTLLHNAVLVWNYAYRDSKALAELKQWISMMTTSMCHEIGHIFRCHLACLLGRDGDRERTPVSVRYDPSRGVLPSTTQMTPVPRPWGESGYTLEFFMLGGVPDVERPDQTMEDWNFGLNFLSQYFEEGKMRARKVPIDVIEAFIAHPAEFPLEEFQRKDFEIVELGGMDPERVVSAEKVWDDDELASEMARYRTEPAWNIENTAIIEEFLKNPAQLVAAVRED